MNLNLLLGLIILATSAATYVFWIRPVLKMNPSFAHFVAQEENFHRAARLKLRGLKQRLATGIILASGFVVSAYDFLAPLAAQSGVDVTTLTDKIPPKAWPLIGMATVALIQYFRFLSDRRPPDSELVVVPPVPPVPPVAPAPAPADVPKIVAAAVAPKK